MHEFVANHGHQVKNVNSFLKDMSNFRRKFYDFYISAHKHHGEETTLCEGYDNNCELLLIPSIMGSDEYSDSLLLGGKAGAKLFIFEKGKGKTVTFSIKLN
jgi:hypothetical protein